MPWHLEVYTLDQCGVLWTSATVYAHSSTSKPMVDVSGGASELGADAGRADSGGNALFAGATRWSVNPVT